MTALEVIDLVESAGGQVSLRGGKVNCRLPEGTDEALIKLLREQRDDIARGLRLREEYIGKANRCYLHGTHDDWYQHSGEGPDRVCAMCHPRCGRAVSVTAVQV
jgi:hypothetical protein